MCEERLVHLVKNKNIEMAKTLAKGIRKNDDIKNIKRENDKIKIETEHFYGYHNIRLVNERELFKWEGIYHLKSDNITLKFTFRSLSDDTIKEINKNLKKENDNSDEKSNNKKSDETVENSNMKEHEKQRKTNKNLKSRLYNLLVTIT